MPPRLLLVALAVFGLVGCSPEVQTDYDAQNSDNFFAACTDPTIDDLIYTRLCQCVIEEVRSTVSYDRFVELDDLMVENPEGAVPDEVVDIVADCVISEAEL